MLGFVGATPVVNKGRVNGGISRAERSTFVGNVFSAPFKRRAASLRMAVVDKSKVPLNLFRPNKPYTAKVVYNESIVGDNAPGETKHMIFNTDGNLQYLEGQSIGVIPPGMDKDGKPHKVRLYSIASTKHGDFGDGKTVSLSVKRLVYTNEAGEEVKGVCSNHLCDLQPGDDVKISGPVGITMLMPQDPNATIIARYRNRCRSLPCVHA